MHSLYVGNEETSFPVYISSYTVKFNTKNFIPSHKTSFNFSNIFYTIKGNSKLFMNKLCITWKCISAMLRAETICTCIDMSH